MRCYNQWCLIGSCSVSSRSENDYHSDAQYLVKENCVKPGELLLMLHMVYSADYVHLAMQSILSSRYHMLTSDQNPQRYLTFYDFF